MLVAYASASHADFMKVTLLGTGSPRPSVDRYGPAVLVEAGGKVLLFDAGRGVVQRLQMLDVPIFRGSACFYYPSSFRSYFCIR